MNLASIVKIIYSLSTKLKRIHPHCDLTSPIQNKLKALEVFCENYVNSYRDTLFANIATRFKDSFQLTKNCSANLYISNSSGESLIEIFDTSINNLTVKATAYPLQYDFTYGADLWNNPSNTEGNIKTYDLQQVLDKDPSVGFMFNMDGDFASAGSSIDNIELRDSKFFRFRRDSMLVSFTNLRSYNIYKSAEYVVYSSRGVCFLTNCGDWYPFLDSIKLFGVKRANLDIQTLFFNSQFFRQVQTSRKLDSLVSSMVERHHLYEASQNINSNVYDNIQFLYDVSVLQHISDSLHLGNNFTNNLIDEHTKRLKPGTIFYTTFTYWHFCLQWIVLNILIFISVLLFVYKINFRNKINSFIIWSPIAIAVGTFGFIYGIAPKGMPVLYCILPGILLLLQLYFLKKLIVPKDSEKRK